MRTVHRSNKTSKFHLLTLFICDISIERDAQLLANRIALLKQEEMKTWKKIEETKKRTNDITNLKKRNEEKVQKVCADEKTEHYSRFRSTPILQFVFGFNFSNFHLWSSKLLSQLIHEL